MKRIGIKYCGGCNSHYDRVTYVRRLMDTSPEAEFEHARTGILYDLLLVVCGCQARCANIETLSASEIRYLCSQEDLVL